MSAPPKANPARPLVSVLIAAYNERRHIEECLSSLRVQDYEPLEILVADDGSTDDTVTLAESAGARTLRLPHRGKALTLNDAAHKARGDILVFLDADMVFEPNYISELTRPILLGQASGTAHGTEKVANETNAWAKCWQTLAHLPANDRLALSAEALKLGSLVFRALTKADFLAAGGFDDIGFADDQTLSPKLGKRAQWVKTARARHYNPETLSEVWSGGRWSGKTILHKFGAKAVWRYSPPVAFARALQLALKHTNPWLVPYILTRDTASFVTLLFAALGRRSHAGK